MAKAQKPNATAQNEALVEGTLAAVAQKVRLNDLFTGAAATAVLLLAYVGLSALLRKLTLRADATSWIPDWCWQIGFFGFLIALAGVVWFTVVRPLRQRVNPRYIARRVEDTLPNAKNGVINWVDLQDKPLAQTVKAAVGANAASAMAEADVDGATQSKKLIWLGTAVGLLVVALGVLFLLFGARQFFDLVGRAANPFKTGALATQTEILVDEPEGGDVTLTEGQPLTVSIRLNGRVPDPLGPTQARLLIRYNPDSDEIVEVPLVKGESSRDFNSLLSRSTILNGFWYRVSAGDATTPEYRVIVRSKPGLSEFQTRYEYPAYLKWPNDREDGSRIKAIRGTFATLSVKANRSVDTASLWVRTPNETVEVKGTISGEKRDELAFRFKLNESGAYQIRFEPAGKEPLATTGEYALEVDLDEAPRIAILEPKEEEITRPANALLAVDAELRDDHGLVSAALRFQIVGRENLEIAPKPYRADQAFLRETDGTYLTEVLDFKDSIKLDQLQDKAGKAVVLKPNDVLEYWVEATDNCTEPKANVGTSRKQRVKLTEAEREPEKKKEDEQKEQKRKDDEKKAEEKRNEQLKNEKRPEDQQRNPEKKADPMQPEGQKDPNNTDPMAGDKKPPEDQDPMGKPNEDRKNGEGKPNPDDLKKEAEKLKDKIENKKQDAGDGKGDGNPEPGQESKPSAEQKPGEPKPENKPSEGKPGESGEKNGSPSESKDPGKLQDPNRSEGKPEPKDDAKGEQKPGEAKPSGKPENKGETGESQGKPSEEPKPQEGDPMKKDGSSGTAKGSEPKEQPMGKPEESKKPEDLGKGKPKADPERGSAKPEKSDGAEKPEEKGAGEAKGEKPNKPGEKKSAQPEKGGDGKPMENKMPPSDAGSEKAAPKEEEQPGAGKGEGKKPETPMGTEKPGDEKGTSKSSEPKPMGNGEKPKDPKDPMNTKDPKGNSGSGEKQPKTEPKDLEKNIEDLDSKDEGTKKAAQDKLDEKFGKENREQIEKMQKDLKSDDPKTREAAKKKIEDMAKEANKGNKPEEKNGELSPMEKADLEKAAKDLNSKNEADRKAAEKKLDEKIGKEKREELQKELSKDEGNDPAGEQKALEKLKEQAKEAKNNQQRTSKDPKKDTPEHNGGGNLDKPGKAIDENPENRLKSMELQLDQFKKYRGKKEFLKENNYTDAEYEKFLKSYEDMVSQFRDDVDRKRLNPNAEATKPSVGRNDGDTKRVGGRTEAGGLQGAGGPAVAPPGFAEAQKRFAAEAAKREAEKAKGK